MKLACLLSDGFEDIEAIGTIALLRRSGIECTIISAFNKKTIIGSYKTEVTADLMMKKMNPDDYDGLFIPGGRHAAILRDEDFVLDLVREFYQKDQWLFAICAAPSIFGKAGILDNKKYISFPSTESFMPRAIRTKEKAVRDGKIITAAGAGAVYDFAFLIIETIFGKDAREEIEKRTQYVLN